MTLPQRTTEDRPLILAVDDAPANLQLLVAALRTEYRVTTATDGASALQAAGRDDMPALILLDVMMPGLSGYEVLKTLRAQAETCHIPVILITGNTSPEDELEGLDLGADDYVTKPVAIPILKARIRNILKHRQTEEQLDLAARVLENTSEGIVITDAATYIVEVNQAYCQIMGYSREEIIGEKPSKVRSGRHGPEFFAEMWRCLNDNGRWVGEIWNRRKNGEVFPKWLTIDAIRNARGQPTHYIGVFSDISQLKEAEAKLEKLAYFDALTGLPNRIMFRDRLEREVTAYRRNGQMAGVFFLDLDRFKNVNDTLGHAAGDQLLVEVAQRLRNELRENDTVARLAGDEFTVILRDVRDADACARVAKTIVEKMAEPIIITDTELFVGISIGIALLPDDGLDADTLLRHADVAMYHAKQAGRSQYRFYDAPMDARTHAHLTLDADLRRALERQELVVHYQPQVDVTTGHLVAAEALLRWNHPVHGMTLPAQFIPLAEDNGLILPLSEWMLHTVCRQVADWTKAGLAGFPVTVNFSARQFRQENLARRIRDIVDAWGIAAEAIEIEITESTAMDNAEAMVPLLKSLADVGFRIAIDDFGSGYFSLPYLKRFPVYKLKMGRSFVMDIPGDANHSAITSAVIGLAKSLGLSVMAVGVETPAQRDFLRALGCDCQQGYLYGEPVAPSTFETLTRLRVVDGIGRASSQGKMLS